MRKSLVNLDQNKKKEVMGKLVVLIEQASNIFEIDNNTYVQVVLNAES